MAIYSGEKASYIGIRWTEFSKKLKRKSGARGYLPER